jgi:hypothetical protein
MTRPIKRLRMVHCAVKQEAVDHAIVHAPGRTPMLRVKDARVCAYRRNGSEGLCFIFKRLVKRKGRAVVLYHTISLSVEAVDAMHTLAHLPDLPRGLHEELDE